MEECCNKEECCKEVNPTMNNAVTEQSVQDAIASEEYMTIGKKTTVCLVTLKNGFEVVGTSACVDEANYDIEIGKPFAKERAMQFVWMHLGFIMQQEMAMKRAEEVLDTAPDFDGAAA